MSQETVISKTRKIGRFKVFTPRTRGTKRKVYLNRVFEGLGLISGQHPDVVAEVRRGLSISVIDKMAAELQVSQGNLLKIIGVSSTTLSRRREHGKRLSMRESDRVYRVASVYRAAIQLFEGDHERARQWMLLPAKALGGHTPLAHLDTQAGADQVIDLIGRIEHGVVT